MSKFENLVTLLDWEENWLDFRITMFTGAFNTKLCRVPCILLILNIIMRSHLTSISPRLLFLGILSSGALKWISDLCLRIRHQELLDLDSVHQGVDRMFRTGRHRIRKKSATKGSSKIINMCFLDHRSFWHQSNQIVRDSDQSRVHPPFFPCANCCKTSD